MLEKKIDRAAHFLKENSRLFRCPVCHASFKPLMGYQFQCEAGHSFDLSKKGTVYFLKRHIDTEYNHEMLLHRQKMIQAGLYEPLLQVLADLLQVTSKSAILDIGCGEGSFLHELIKKKQQGNYSGFDLSKEGIQLATDHPSTAFWCVADLTNLPFQTHSMDYLLNIFSPSHYEEFKRVLKEEGEVIKVIPEANYLKELRQLFYEDNEAKQTYSNEKVIEKFAAEVEITSQQHISYTFSVPKALYPSLLKMSPLHWGASEEAQKNAARMIIQEITIDVQVIKGKMNRSV